MLHIDDALLERIGLGDLPADAKEAHKKLLGEKVELAVLMRLLPRMSDEQLYDREQLKDAPEHYRLAWLHINFPDYLQIAGEELQRLAEELARGADEILSLELGYARS